MSQVNDEYHRQARMRSLDTVRVHNPTSEDYVFWNDKGGNEPRKIMVPKAQKDIGFGKGNTELPRFLAERYTKAMITQLITKKSDKLWKEKSKEYRTRDERIQHADVEQVRTNDPERIGEWFPKIWLGVVEKFGGDIIPDPEESVKPTTGNVFNDVMRDMADKEVEVADESA